VIGPLFNGLVLIAPLITLKYPTWIRYFIKPLAYLFSTATYPSLLFDDNSINTMVWSNSNYRQYIEDDGYPHNLNGLSYGGNIRFSTLLSVFNICHSLESIIHNITCPFIVIYDEDGDIIVSEEGVSMLMKFSPSKNKTRIYIEDGLHDPLANKLEYVSEHILSWCKKIFDIYTPIGKS
jgi:alpha-beta hydrolase superfamily lysophospholipase